MRLTLIVSLLSWSALAAPPTTCGLPGEYAGALCAYQRRDFAEAERRFEAIVGKRAENSETLRATYFLARTKMKRGRFDEASSLLIRIYGLDKPFYDAWNCDFLLGECRRALGR
jgi:TolA-binding protein